MSDENNDSEPQLLTINQGLGKVMETFIRMIVIDVLDRFDMEAYVDSRVRAVMEKMKREH